MEVTSENFLTARIHNQISITTEINKTVNITQTSHKNISLRMDQQYKMATHFCQHSK